MSLPSETSLAEPALLAPEALQLQPVKHDSPADPVPTLIGEQDSEPVPSETNQPVVGDVKDAFVKESVDPLPRIEEHPPWTSDLTARLDAERRRASNRKLNQAIDALEDGISKYLHPQAPNRAVPAALELQLDNLRGLATEATSRRILPRRPDGLLSDDNSWVCEVQRDTMDNWSKKGSDQSPPAYVMRAFYDNIPDSRESVRHGEHHSTNTRERPHRVAINSLPLKKELQEISGLDLSMYTGPLLVAAPYKLFSMCYPLIKERLVKLKGELSELDEEEKLPTNSADVKQGDHTAESAQIPIAGGHGVDASKETPVSLINGFQSDTQTAKPPGATPQSSRLTTRISQLQLLQDFIESDLAHYLELQASIKNGTLETIAFEDIWYLFQPGDVLFVNSTDQDQLCRAYSITGGQIRRCNQAPDAVNGLRRPTVLPRTPQQFEKRDVIRLDDEDSDDHHEEEFKDMIHEATGIGTWSHFTIDSYVMGFDGVRIGPLECPQRIPHYEGTRSITELPVYPLRFHSQSDEIAARQVKRGQKYMTSYGHKKYDGVVARRGYREEVRGDVFIDVKHFYRAFHSSKPNLGVLRKSKADTRETNEFHEKRARFLVDHLVDNKMRANFMASHPTLTQLTKFDLGRLSPECLQLFVRRIPAYVFRTRRYAYCDIENVSDIDKSDKARDEGFDDLVIDPTYRNLLIPLVQNHARDGGSTELNPDSLNAASSQIDIVRGKGRGLIILLHGPPGSGKTSTAETIAAYTRRPLYSITCGDLGITPVEVEQNLMRHTDRAQRWGCVLLLDEADVFLTRRDWRDTTRNALVSIFLRQLEYYSGILFLTTNRVGVIDEAFKSRIHLSLLYPRIELKETLEMWENILNRIDRDNKVAKVKIEYDRHDLLAYARKHFRNNAETETTWNGRQIRNAFQTAIALCNYEREQAMKSEELTDENGSKNKNKKWRKVKLRPRHFRGIAATAKEFERYLSKVRGEDSYLAQEEGLRRDSHFPQEGALQDSYKKTSKQREQLQSKGVSNRATRVDRSRSKNAARGMSEDEDEDEDDEDKDDDDSDEDEGSDIDDNDDYQD